MKNHEIRMQQIKEMTEQGIATFTKKDDSPRGCQTITANQVKPGDEILIDNYFHTVIEDETREEQTARENWEYCKSIAEDLEAYTDGNGYRCPLCGEVHQMTEYEETEHENESGETCYTCPNCGGSIEESELEAVSVYDYFDGDIYDIEYRIGSNRDFRSVRIMIACGGPNIYIDTAAKAIQLFWWSDSAEYPISYEAAEAVNAYFEELYNC